jgi:hypothetical protein
MKWLRTQGGIISIAIILVAAGFGLFPNSAQAQATSTPPTPGPCAATPAPAGCTSFDPAVNPMLIKEGWGSYVGGTPKTIEYEGRGTCQMYAVGLLGRIVGETARYGCLKDGKFTLYSDASIVDASGGAVAPIPTEVTKEDGSKELQQPQGDGNSCGFTDFFSPSKIPRCLMAGVGYSILAIANFFLAIAGVVLNFVVIKTVFEFGNVIGNSEGLLIAWGILRDIGNMLLLFGFIFMGLATILDLHSFPVKKALPRLLIFAILMNFSLFAAEAVIDITNGLSAAIYKQANTDPDACSDITFVDCSINYGLAGSVMKSTGLSTMFSIKNGFVAADSVGETVAVYITLALFATIGAIVFMATAIMLIIRLITLTFLMVTSPIGFAGMAIPPLQGYAELWWKKLISQAVFAPVLILLIFVSLKITETFNTVSENGLAGAITQGNTSVLSIIMVFFVVIGFMIGSLVAAKNIGASGSAKAIGIGKGMVLGSYGAIGGYAGRKTIGQGSAAVQKRYEAWMGKDNQSSGGKRLRSIISNTKLDDAIAGTLKKGQAARFGSSKSFEEDQKHHKARNEEFKKAARKVNVEAKIKEAAAANDETKMAEALKSLSDSEFAELGILKEGNASLALIAQSLTPERFKKLMDNDKVSSGVKAEMVGGRFKDLKDAVASGDEKKVRSWSSKDLEVLSKYDQETFKKLTEGETAQGGSLLSGEQMEALQKGEVSNPQKQLVKEGSNGNRIQRLLSAAGTGGLSSADQTKLTELMDSVGGSKNVAKLPASVLTNPNIANKLTTSQLAAIAAENNLGSQQQSKLGALIMARKARGLVAGATPEEAKFAKYLTDNPVVESYYDI